MIRDYFALAINNLKRRGIRSWLTMLGIFIGIAAVVSLISLGTGLQEFINEQFAVLGADKITIMGRAGFIVSPIASELSNKPLTESDVDLVGRINEVELVSSFLIKSLDITFKREVKSFIISGVEPDEYQELFSKTYSMDVGEDVGKIKGNEVVIGYNTANKDFDHVIGVGDSIKVLDKSFKVIGIIKKIGSPPDDSSIIMDKDVLRDLSKEKEIVSMIFLQVKENSDVLEVSEEIERKMKKDRNEDLDEDPKTFSVQTAEQLLNSFSKILGSVQAVLVGIAGISLLVGGIGIMNTMYTSVLERTREIGIMKAVGAKNSDIFTLFLIESGLLGLVGGLIGVVIGIALGKGAEYAAEIALGASLLKASFPLSLILGTLLFSFTIGSLSGLLPAIQASKMNPVDALRYE